jgi:DNA ligase-associated metallophosphoesterase
MTHALHQTLVGETVVLLAERALFWPREATLVIADLHLGKAATMRAAALPIPGGTTADDLARLDRALDRTGARRLVVLGDLLHARAGRAPTTLDTVAAWRGRHQELAVLVVRGNHDAHAGDPPPDWQFLCVDEPHEMPPFVLRHHPAADTRGYVLAGHLHPAARLVGSGRQREQLPCFWLGERVGILPAFGGFTGAAAIQPAPGDTVVVVAGGALVQIRPGR